MNTEMELKQNGLTVDVDRQQFALQLKTWRLRSGLTQRQVAQRFGCSRYTIMAAEAAKDITWRMAYRLFVKLSQELQQEAGAEYVRKQQIND